MYDDKLCCSETGSALLSIFLCNDDGRPLSITYPDICICNTHKAILYPIRMLYMYFQEQFSSGIIYLYQKKFVTFCLFLFLLCFTLFLMVIHFNAFSSTKRAVVCHWKWNQIISRNCLYCSKYL